MTWWRENVDEIIIGLAIAGIAIASIFHLGSESIPIASTSVTALGVYLGAKNGFKRSQSTNKDGEDQ